MSQGGFSKINSKAQIDYYAKDEVHENHAASYYVDKDAPEYSESRETGIWYDPGQLTSKSLHGKAVTQSDFEKILNGTDPDLLVKRKGKNGEDIWVNKPLVRNSGKEKRVMGIDIALSAPKPVSLLWMCADEKNKRLIEKAQADAALEAVKFADQYLIQAGRGAGSLKLEKAQCMAAIYNHKTTREEPKKGEKGGTLIAPGLHTHCVFAGMVRGQTPGTKNFPLVSLREKKMTHWRSATENVYHLTLAKKLSELGFEIETPEKGKTAFKIKGMEQFQDACDALSLRSKHIEETMKGKDRKDWTRAEEKHAALLDRRSKVAKPREELDRSWEEAIKDVGVSKADVKRFIDEQQTLAAKKEPVKFRLEEKQVALLREEIAAELHENGSTFKEGVLYGRLAFKLQGQCDREDVDHLFAQIKGGLVPVSLTHDGEQMYASQQQVDIERDLVRLAKTPTPQHVLDKTYVEKMIAERQTPELVKKDKAMTPAQAEAVREMLCGSGSARLIGISQGRAGSGKSFSADAIKGAYESLGYTVHGTCLGYKQSKILQVEGNFKYTTAIAAFCRDLEQGKTILGPKSVILIDEGGLVSSQDMLRMTRAAHDAGSKIVLTGDSLQLGAIGGEAFKTLTNSLGSTVIGETAAEIRRQKVGWQAQAGLDIANQNAKAAVAAYRENGHFHIANDRAGAVSAIVASVKAHMTERPEQSRIIIATTRADVKELNKQIREVKRDIGIISGQDHTVRCGNGKDDIYSAQLAVGDRIQFRHNGNKEQDIYNRTTATITKIDTSSGEPVFHALLENGGTTTFSASPGDKSYDEKSKSLLIEPAHCQTLFSSQGATVDKAFVYDRANLDRLQAYVACTRHRLDLEIHVDRESLADKIVTPDNWRSPSKLTEEEIFKNISQRWTSSEDKKSTYDLMNSPEEKLAEFEKTRAENLRIIASAQLAHEATREFTAFESREAARKLTPITTREASNDLVFDHTKELNYGQLQLARRAAIYQSNAAEVGLESTTSTLASVRELSSIGLVFEQSRDEVLLHENELDKLGQESDANLAVRRSGTGDPRPQSQASEVVQAPEAPDFSNVTIFVPPSGRPDLVAQLGTSPLIIAGSRENAESIATNELAANAPATVAVVENQNDVSLQYPAIREAIQSPNQAIVFAGDVDGKTREAVMRIAAESVVEKAEHDYRDLVKARGEREINQPEH